jgi:hypothetical protein
MTATPLLIPAYVREKKFDIVHAQQASFLSGGFIQTLDRATPFWMAEFTTPPLIDARADEFQGFLDYLEQSNNSFRAWDPARQMPRAYQTQALASDPWTQTGQTNPRISAADYAASTITLDRVQIGAIFTQGDYISVYYNPGWLLFRVVTSATAAANTQVLSIKPRPQTSLLTAMPLNIVYRRACAEFKLMQRPEKTDSVDSLPVFSLKAMQFIDRTLP